MFLGCFVEFVNGSLICLLYASENRLAFKIEVIAKVFVQSYFDCPIYRHPLVTITIC